MVEMNKFGELETTVCPACGDPIKAGWVACPACGAVVTKGQAVKKYLAGDNPPRDPNICVACQTFTKAGHDAWSLERKFCPACKAFICGDCLGTALVSHLFSTEYYCPVCRTRVDNG